MQIVCYIVKVQANTSAGYGDEAVVIITFSTKTEGNSHYMTEY